MTARYDWTINQGETTELTIKRATSGGAYNSSTAYMTHFRMQVKDKAGGTAVLSLSAVTRPTSVALSVKLKPRSCNNAAQPFMTLVSSSVSNFRLCICRYSRVVESHCRAALGTVFDTQPNPKNNTGTISNAYFFNFSRIWRCDKRNHELFRLGQT